MSKEEVGKLKEEIRRTKNSIEKLKEEAKRHAKPGKTETTDKTLSEQEQKDIIDKGLDPKLAKKYLNQYQGKE